MNSSKRLFARCKGTKPGAGGWNCPCCTVGNNRKRKRDFYRKLGRRELERLIERIEAHAE